MTRVQVLDASPDRSGGCKVDVGRGQRVGWVSSEWFSRPADERYLSLDALMASVKGRAERSRTRTVESAAVRVEASRDNAERLDLILPGAEQALQAEAKLRTNPQRRADRFFARWQEINKTGERQNPVGDMSGYRATRSAMGDMAKSLKRDPQLESILSDRTAQFGIG